MTLVGFRSSKCNILYTAEGITLIEACKSSKAFSIVSSPIGQGMVKWPGSSDFLGKLEWDRDETVCTLFCFKFLLYVHNSFKNLANLEIYLMSSSCGIFISTFRKISSKSLSFSSFLGSNP